MTEEQRPRRARGQSLVEFSLILPVLIILLLGALDFGRLLQARVTAESAIRAGASWGATGLSTARQPLQPAGSGTCGSGNYSFSPSCNILARACTEASGFPDFAGGQARTGSGGTSYLTCSSGSDVNVCTPGASQSNPFIALTWKRSDGSTYVPTNSSPPLAGDTITLTGTFCFKTLTSYPVIPNQVTLATTSVYTVQQ